MAPVAGLRRLYSVVSLGRLYSIIGSDRTIPRFFLAYFLLFAVVTTYQQGLPLLYRAVGVPIAAYGIAKSVGNGLEAVASAPAGVLVDELGSSLVAIVAGLGIASVLVVLPLASTALALGVLVVVLAVARLVLGVALTPLVDSHLEEGSEGLGWGLRDVGIYLGSAVGLGVAGGVVARSGAIQSLFLVLVPVVGLLLVLLWHIRRPTLDSLPTLEAIRSSRAFDIRGAWNSISRPAVLARILAVDLFVTLGMGMSFFLLPVYAVDLGLDRAAFLFIFGGSHLFAAPLSVAGGALADRLPRKWLYAGNYWVEAVMLGVFALAGGPVMFGLGVTFFVLQTGFEPAVLAYFFDQFDESESGRAWGLDGTVERGAGLVAPAVGGAIYSIDPALPFGIGAVLTVVGAAIALTLPR